MSRSTLNISESGSFRPVSNVCAPNIFNPGVYEERRNSYQATDRHEAIAKWRHRNVGKKKWKFTAAQIDAYADAAVKLTAAISANYAPCRLAPLRGAARPCMLIGVMSGGAAQFEFFDFREGSKGLRDREICSDLLAILNRTNPHTELFQIQIVDTAKGGNGINKLIALLRNIHDESQAFRNQHWSIDAHLLYPTVDNQNINNIYAARLIRSPKFSVDDFQLYPVPIVVGEDFGEASDFEFIKDGNLLIPKPRALGAGFLLENQNGEQLIETDNVFLTFDEFFSEAITNSLLTDPNRVLAEIVWKKVRPQK